MKKSLATIAIVSAALFGITGCSMGGADTSGDDAGASSMQDTTESTAPDGETVEEPVEEQSVADGCAIVGDRLAAGGNAFDQLRDLSFSETAAQGQPILAEMRSASGEVTNADVNAAYVGFIDAYSAVIDAILADPAAADSDPTVVANEWSAVADAATAVTDLCGEDIFD